MVWFILLAPLLLTVAFAFVLRPILSGAATAESRDAAEMALYRDQLSEIDRDVDRGVVTPEEADGTKAEIARRLIAAGKRAEAAEGVAAKSAPAGLSRKAAIGTLVVAPVLAGGLYLGTGAPGAPDRPLASRDLVAEARAQRPSQEEAEVAALRASTEGPRRAGSDPEYSALVARLEAVVAERPNDAEGHRLLYGALMNQGRFADAWPVVARLIEIRAEAGDAVPADLFAAQAEAMILAARGYVSPGAEDALASALQRDPALPVARYYAGLALAQAGREQEALALWTRLEREAPPTAPWLPFLREALAEMRGEAAPDPLATLIPQPGEIGSRGPDAADIEAARNMSPEDRQAFIESMVSSLEDRLLSEEGGTADEWARLLRSYVNLGRPEDARRIYALSQERLRGAEAGFVRERALVLGLIDG